MTLRTKSVRQQRQVWSWLTLFGIVAYFVLVLAFDLGNPFRFFGPRQLRVFLPLVIVLRVLARECRWDGALRKGKPEEDEEEKEPGAEAVRRSETAERSSGQDEPGAPSAAWGEGDVRSPTPRRGFGFSAPAPAPVPVPVPASDFVAEDPEELWARAVALEEDRETLLPPEENETYLQNVHGAAEGGHVAALARLGELALCRGAYVEAYFWTKVAHRRLELADPSETQGLREIGDMLRKIRCAWAMAGQPPEFENVYDFFPEERGELGRAFLRLDGGFETKPTREYVRLLAENGNPDARLFVPL